MKYITKVVVHLIFYKLNKKIKKTIVKIIWNKIQKFISI
jgi:hypothetical protein